MQKKLKGYTFRLYPNIEQKILIEKSFAVQDIFITIFWIKQMVKNT